MLVAAVVENSDDGDSSDELGARRRGSGARSLPGAAARTAKTHPGAGNACCTHPRTADTESGAHYLKQKLKLIIQPLSRPLNINH